MKASVAARQNALNRLVFEATTFHALKIDVRYEVNEYLYPPV